MAKFQYQARAATGNIVQGEIEAATQQEAIIRLRAQQLMPTKLVAMARSSGAKAGSGSAPMFGGRVKGKDLQIFTRQFATLINAGIPVVDCLKILSEGLRPGPLREAAGKVKGSIESGRRLADSMGQVPLVFDKLYVNMIQAGEEAGILDGILNRLALYMEKSEKLKSQVKGALVYPAVILVVAFAVITGILVFILPKFMEFFNSAGKEPPALTQMVVALSNSMIHKWYLYVAAVVGIPFAILQYYRTNEGRDTMDRLFFNVPVFGEVIQKSAIARLTRTLSTLLSSGVGLIEAIDISAKTAGNIVIEQALLRCKASVTEGRTFASPLGKEKVFPEMVVQMISIGEQSGTMDVMLGKIADFYEDEVETAVKAMTSLLEPLMMVFLGGIIAILVIAMYLPIFSMADVVGGG
ncbi:type II secretion system F family protein [Bdellovibrio sp. SKB1291214]|uniref:type II secretion system F family protein n=1 Tax=Bdellovibrio sp. SKB1291214 TaxID=1732569 RepID=UPI000B51AB3C|nr:type II secretion system F family protein [Bdellovibrio sp. SKB1291214]UYL08515.1 type II secretion system F family protein [Bdellovibrio sp. SKB1291214]